MHEIAAVGSAALVLNDNAGPRLGIIARKRQLMNEILRRIGRHHDLAILKAQEHFVVHVRDKNAEKPPARNVTPAAERKEAAIANPDSPPGNTCGQRLGRLQARQRQPRRPEKPMHQDCLRRYCIAPDAEKRASQRERHEGEAEPQIAVQQCANRNSQAQKCHQ